MKLSLIVQNLSRKTFVRLFCGYRSVLRWCDCAGSHRFCLLSWYICRCISQLHSAWNTYKKHV